MDSSTDCKNTDEPLVAPLQCFGRDDLARVGGKAANLGELIQAGFPVPVGFVATTAAYDRFVEGSRLEEKIAQELSEGNGNPAAIRSAFERAQIPDEVEGAILEAYRQLGSEAVAVRSSATAEDLPEAAFAGQQDTYLNIRGEEQLLESVRRCWSSLWTDRAVAYRRRQELDQQAVKLAVVVQCMSVAEAAGVLFTANPVTGARDEIVIDASPGLGEAVVSGLVTPDHFVLQKRRRGWRIAQRQKGRSEVVIRPRADGGTEQVEGGVNSAVQALPDKALYTLARLGSTIQDHFGKPQDIEWAWDGRRIDILQARPITALPEPAPHQSLPMQMHLACSPRCSPSVPTLSILPPGCLPFLELRSSRSFRWSA